MRRFPALICIALLAFGGLASAQESAPAKTAMSPLPPKLETPAEKAANAANTASLDTRTSALPGAPFGSNLFEGQFAADARNGLNPGYRVQPGDQVMVAIWGGGDLDTTVTLTVDAQGKIFIPGVGPVPVGGIDQSNLNQAVSSQVSKYYQDSVQVYTSLQGAQAVSVFVTGGVVSPGRYSGSASDSLLHYLDRAKGIDPGRGSYRTIDVLRGSTKVVSVDIYDFLMRGTIPDLQLKDNDVILVHGLANTVTTSGEVQNPYRFEFTTPTLMGGELIEMARPMPGTTHAIVSGIRDGQGFANYMSLADLAQTDIRQGDTVAFKEGTLTASLTVTIEGEHLGPQVIVAPANAHLDEVLRHVRIDKDLADIHSIYLRRRSVAERQRIALHESLRRLEEGVLSAKASTEADAKIQVEEAKLVTMFIERAKQVQPEGRVVITEDGELRDLALEDGDTIVIPRKTNLVMVNGEVTMPKAVIYKEGEGPDYYIERAGGYNERADEGKIVLARLNGETMAGARDVRPGDEIIVMPEVGFSQLQVTKDVVDILYKVAIAIAVPLQL